MYTVGERVVYSIHGVCTVVALEKRRVDRKTVEYLALEPLEHPGSRYYVPINNEIALSKIRPLLTPAQMEELLHSTSGSSDLWIEQEGLRKVRYRELLSGNDRKALLSMIAQLYRYKEELVAKGRKFHLTDETFLRDAEKMIISEIAYIMEFPVLDARNYLHQMLCVRE